MAFDPSTAQPVDSDASADTGAFDPSTAQPVSGATSYDPTEGMSTTEKVLAGAGKGLVDTAHGTYQLGAAIGHAAGLVSDEKMAQIQQDIDEAHKSDEPLMNTTAGKVGNVIGTAAPALLVPGAGVMGGIASGAAMGAVQPVATGEHRSQNIGMGAVGGAAGGLVGKFLKALGGFGVPMERQAASDLLTKEGIPTSVAQKTGAKGAQHVERMSAMISDAQHEFMGEQTPAFNRAVLRRIGVTDPEVEAATPDVLGPAKKRITDVMDTVAGKANTKVDDTMLNDMGEVEENVNRSLPETDQGPVKRHISDILTNASENDGHLDGTFYQKIHSSLGDLQADPRYAPFAKDLQEALHDGLTRSSPGDAAALNAARQKYWALKRIEPAVDPSTGNISPLKLMSSLSNKANRNRALYGEGDQDLMNLAKAAKQVLPDSLGNSGTPERLLLPLSAMETLRSGEGLWKPALKMAAGVYGGGLAGRAMRNQGPVGKTLAEGLPGLSTVRSALNTKTKAPIGPIKSSVTPANITRRVPRAVGFGAAESKQRDQPLPDTGEISRASGGRVEIGQMADNLINRWKNAKRATDETTKPLLRVPDETIAKALDVAGRAI